MLFRSVKMIDKQDVLRAAEQAIAGTDMFIVDARVGAGNAIVVELDSPGSMDLDTVAAVSRSIEAALDRDKEDFELEVGSAGLTAPFKVRAQYDKNIGNEVEVFTTDGRKLRGTLVETTDDGFTISFKVKEKPEGAKRPVLVDRAETFAYSQAKKEIGRAHV